MLCTQSSSEKAVRDEQRAPLEEGGDCDLSEKSVRCLSYDLSPYQAREPRVHGIRSIVAVEIAEATANSYANCQCHPRTSGPVFPAEQGMDELDVGQGSQASTGNVNARDPAADDTDEYESIQPMR